MKKRNLIITVLLLMTLMVGVGAVLPYFIYGETEVTVKEQGIILKDMNVPQGVVNFDDSSYSWDVTLRANETVMAQMVLGNLAATDINCSLHTIGSTSNVRSHYEMNGVKIQYVVVPEGNTEKIDLVIETHRLVEPDTYVLGGEIN
ncbi:MAG: hypothetical protein KAX49_03815 [Halanaerobiales bacterium]|nr:hypothetical protein [Halanaerobiales bacterium]